MCKAARIAKSTRARVCKEATGHVVTVTFLCVCGKIDMSLATTKTTRSGHSETLLPDGARVVVSNDGEFLAFLAVCSLLQAVDFVVVVCF